MKPGASAVRLDVAAQKAGIPFQEALHLVRSGQVLGFTYVGHWYTSEAAIPILAKLRPLAAAQDRKAGQLSQEVRMDTSNSRRSAGLPPMPPEVAAIRARRAAANMTAQEFKRQQPEEYAAALAEGEKKERARGAHIARLMAAGHCSPAEALALIEAGVEQDQVDVMLAKVRSINGHPAARQEVTDADIKAALARLPKD